MKEKRKGKFIPFASYLRPTEELLWQSAESVDILASLIPKASLSNFISLALFLMVAGGCGIMFNSKPDDLVGVLGVIIAMIGMGLVVIRYTMRWASSKQMLNIAIPEQARYAITSERLFYERGSDLRAESLDNISAINVLPDNTLSFGAAFPQWSGLEDAEHIKFIIEQAQKERRKEQSTANVMNENTLTSDIPLMQQPDPENIERGQSHH
jgi:hypothetical protein